MLGLGTHLKSLWRGSVLVLAVLALMMKVAAPPGFMIATPGAGGGFPLVICTGHGPQSLDANGKPDKGDAKGKSDAPCAFEGHAAPPTPSLGVALITEPFAQPAALDARRLDLVPGRGLAAPPPPSQGPPILL